MAPGAVKSSDDRRLISSDVLDLGVLNVRLGLAGVDVSGLVLGNDCVNGSILIGGCGELFAVGIE